MSFFLRTYPVVLSYQPIMLSFWIDHWIGSRENLNPKPWFLPWKIWGFPGSYFTENTNPMTISNSRFYHHFPIVFPSIQSNEFQHPFLNQPPGRPESLVVGRKSHLDRCHWSHCPGCARAVPQGGLGELERGELRKMLVEISPGKIVA